MIVFFGQRQLRKGRPVPGLFYFRPGRVICSHPADPTETHLIFDGTRVGRRVPRRKLRLERQVDFLHYLRAAAFWAASSPSSSGIAVGTASTGALLIAGGAVRCCCSSISYKLSRPSHSGAAAPGGGSRIPPEAVALFFVGAGLLPDDSARAGRNTARRPIHQPRRPEPFHPVLAGAGCRQVAIEF